MYNEQDRPLQVDFSQKLKNELRVIAIWARLGAIFSFITTAFIFAQNMSKGVAQIIVMLIMCGICVVMASYLFSFGNKIKKGIEGIDQNELEAGFNSLRLYFKICVRVLIGVLVLVILSILLKAGGPGIIPGLY
jgi:uncharacterized membrane protein YesL